MHLDKPRAVGGLNRVEQDVHKRLINLAGVAPDQGRSSKEVATRTSSWRTRVGVIPRWIGAATLKSTSLNSASSSRAKSRRFCTMLLTLLSPSSELANSWGRYWCRYGRSISSSRRAT